MTSVSRVYGVVYAITNELTNTVYIGQTSKPVKERWGQHRSALRRGTHGNIRLQRAWNRDGAGVFTFSVLVEAPDLDALDEAEQFYIEYLRYCGADLYNFRAGGGSQRRLAPRAPMSEATRQKLREAHLRSGHQPPPHARELARIASTARPRTALELARWRASNAGRTWTPEQRKQLSEAQRGIPKTVTPALRAKWEAQRGRKEAPEQTARRIAAVVCNQPLHVFRAPDGSLHETRNISALARAHGLHERLLNYVATGKQRHHRGWTLVEVRKEGQS